MSTLLRVLIVEDSENDALLIIDELRDGGYDPEYERVETREQMRTALERQEWDIVIADYKLPDFDGLEALQIAQSKSPNCPYILISGQISEDAAVNAMKAGANDYILKNNLARLVPAVERELREAELRRQRVEVQEALQEERERSHDILESITDGFFALDKDWRFIYVNGEAERLIGSNWRALKGKSFWETLPNLPGTALYNLFQDTMTTRTPGSLEWFSERMQGWYVIRTYPYADGIAVYIRDINDQKRAEEELRQREELLQTIQNSLTAQIAVLDHKGTIIAVNETWEETARANGDFDFKNTGVGVNYLDICRRAAERGDEGASKALAGISSVIGNSTSIFEMEYPFKYKEEPHWFYMRVTPLRSGKGGAVVVHLDITNRKLAEEAVIAEKARASALESIAEAGIATVNLQELLDTLVVRMTEVLQVHSCTIWILDEEAGEFIARAERGYSGAIGNRLPTTEGIAGIVYKDRRPVYTGDAEHDPLILDPVLKEEGTKSVLSVPLIARGRVVGMTRIDEQEERIFTGDEVGLIEAMASRAAQAIENIKLYDALTRSRQELQDALERERHFSLLLQRALLPEEPSIDSGYNIGVQYIPYYMGREIGGDFYDIFEAADGRAGIVIGDVSGKGLESASLAAATRSTIHALVHEAGSAGEVLARANSILCKRQTTFETNFVTVFLAIINLRTGNICYASAGHPPAAIYRANGEVHYLQPDFQPPICLILGIDYPEARDYLEPGDALVMFTDGVAEARKGSNLFDLEGIEQTLKEIGHLSADEIAGELIAAASSWAEGHLSDDAAIVVIKREGRPEESV